MAIDQTNIVVCPSCGAENIEGIDTCDNCLADLRSIDVPGTSQIASDSDLALPINCARISRVRTVAPTVSVREAVSFMKSEASAAVVVVDRGKIVGIFTERDVLHRVAAWPGRLDETVGQHMTHDPVVLREDDPMAAALNKMGDGGFRHIPVVRDGQVVGMITGRDIWAWVLGRYFG